MTAGYDTAFLTCQVCRVICCKCEHEEITLRLYRIPSYKCTSEKSVGGTCPEKPISLTVPRLASACIRVAHPGTAGSRLGNPWVTWVCILGVAWVFSSLFKSNPLFFFGLLHCFEFRDWQNPKAQGFDAYSELRCRL